MLGIIAPMFLMGGLAGWVGPRPGSEATYGPMMVSVRSASRVRPIFALLGSRVALAGADGLRLRDLYSQSVHCRRIAFDRIESIIIKPGNSNGDEPRGEFAKIREGRSITLHSSTPGFHEILAVVRARAGIEPVPAAMPPAAQGKGDAVLMRCRRTDRWRSIQVRGDSIAAPDEEIADRRVLAESDRLRVGFARGLGLAEPARAGGRERPSRADS